MSDFVCNPKNGLWEAPLHTRLRLDFLTQNAMALGKVKVLFSGRFWKIRVSGLSRNYRLSESLLHLICWPFFENFLTFIDYYATKSDIKGETETAT